MNLTLYQVDAFADQLFEGNPAAICPLTKWLPDKLMQSIATENNLSETAFFVKQGNQFHIRWFTPTKEVDLCGHATLASAYIIFNELNFSQPQIEFNSRSGKLTVFRQGDWFYMDFPAQLAIECKLPEEIENAFSQKPLKCLKHDDYILVFSSEDEVANASPDFQLLSKIDLRGVCITAEGKHFDFVSRFFAPKYGINEDPVTGSSYTQLIPYWSNRLNKTKLIARQISARGGDVKCELQEDRVIIAGKAVKYSSSTVFLE